MYLAVYLKLSIIYKVSGRKIFPFIALVLLRYKLSQLEKMSEVKEFLNRYLSSPVYKMMSHYACT